MIVSFFRGGSLDNEPLPVNVPSWDHLLGVIAPGDRVPGGVPAGKHMVRATTEKESTPAWSPAEYRQGAGVKRSKANVVRVHAFVLDVDNPPPEKFAQLRARLQGFAYHAHTSWSHATEKKPIAMRIAVKLSRPVEAAEWPKFWRAASAYFADVNDPATKDCARLFFCAAMPAGSPAQHLHSVLSVPGQALDVDDLLHTVAPDADVMQALGLEPVPGAPVGGRIVTAEEVNEFAHGLARSRSPKKAEIGKRLKKMILGERFAFVGMQDELGGIDNAIFRMAGFLAQEFHDADPVALAKHFEKSLKLQLKEDGDGHSVDDVANKIERAQAEVRQSRAEADAMVLAARAGRIREAFGDPNRVDGYRKEEAEAFGDLKSKWIIQYGSNFYVFFDGDYRPPVSDKALVAAAARDLAPAHTMGVEVFKLNAEGVQVPKTVQELVLEYGSVAHNVQIDLSASRSTFDMQTRTFVEATCPLRVRSARFVPEIDDWLRAADDPKLLQWVALVSKVARPCNALYLDGVKGAGKSLLAHGLARFWTTGGPTSAVNAFGTWTEDIASCPLVFADEALPPKIRASGYTGELREFVQASRRHITRKYKPNAQTIGAIRLILAANNKNLLETNEALTPNDIAAISDRFLYVKMPEACAAVLKKIGGREKIEQLFIQENGLAAHSLWLAENLKDLPDTGRFFFDGGSEEIARTLTTGSGVRGSICTWLAMYLINPEALNVVQGGRKGPPLVFVKNGTLHVSPAALSQDWLAYKINRQPPSPAQAGAALRGLSLEGVVEVGDVTYYQIDRRNLTTWAEETGYCSAQQLISKLENPTPQASQMAV